MYNEFVHLISLFLPHSVVFRPGDEGFFWYTVIAGSLEMLQGDTDTNKVRR